MSGYILSRLLLRVGALDVYLSVESQLLLVDYNQSAGYNTVHFDTKYPITRDSKTGTYCFLESL